MFKRARLVLTGWYLLIIMLISGMFSAVIYRSINAELSRVAVRQVGRVEHEIGYPVPPQLTNEILEDSRVRLVRTLVVINLTILGLAGIGGYYLSGKTLSPIQSMMDMQNDFVTNASHDLKTPLTAMRTSVEVALRDPKLIDKLARKQLEANLSDIKGMQSLAENLLDLTKSYTTVTPVPTELNKVIEEVVGEVAPLLSAKKIKLTTQGPKDLIVKVDKLMFDRALVAIVDNAIKYNHQGGTIKISQKKIGKMVRLSIKDSGEGISASELAHVRERFYRGNKSRTGSSGYGLGLSIAEQIIMAHNGKLEITSKTQTGTEVVISLPLSASNQHKLS